MKKKLTQGNTLTPGQLLAQALLEAAASCRKIQEAAEKAQGGAKTPRQRRSLQRLHRSAAGLDRELAKARSLFRRPATPARRAPAQGQPSPALAAEEEIKKLVAAIERLSEEAKGDTENARSAQNQLLEKQGAAKDRILMLSRGNPRLNRLANRALSRIRTATDEIEIRKLEDEQHEHEQPEESGRRQMV
jgi:hypothetical protein